MRLPTLLLACALAAACGSSDVQHSGGGRDGGTGGVGADGGGAGGDAGGDSGPTFANSCNGSATTITGMVLAPNGKDPVANAFVYVAPSTTPFKPGVACELCDMPVDVAAVTATTDASGRFTLDLGRLPPATSVPLTVDKGRFRRTSAIGVTACGATAAAAAATTLPGKSGNGDDIPKIAVATGNKDQLDAVLVAMGLDAKLGFDCFEGRTSTSALTSPCGSRGTLPAIETLLGNPAMLAQYNLLFISCAPGKFKALGAATQQAIAANLVTWTGSGGRLFVTDNSYDYIAQAFPKAAAFLNGNSGVDAANVGYGTSGAGTRYAGRINDPTLAAWLAAVGAVPPGSNTIALSGYLNKWSVVQSVPMSTDDVVDATNAQAYIPANSTTPGAPTTYPQTLRFDIVAPGASSACGRAIYSSYHTLPTTASPTPTDLVPQERILEYLMLEAGACLGGIS
jgi:hypothetical protein